MKTGQQSQPRIVDQAGIQRHSCPSRAAAEEVYFSTFADEVNGRFPGVRLPDSLNDGVESDAALLANRADMFRFTGDVEGGFRSQAQGSGQPCFPTTSDGDLAARLTRQNDEH